MHVSATMGPDDYSGQPNAIRVMPFAVRPVVKWVLLTFLIVFQGAWCNPLFTKISTDESGFLPVRPERGHGLGLAAADFDADGDIDVFLPTEAGTAHVLYENQGDGSFLDSAALRGVNGASRHARTALWFDSNGDGLLDLVTASDCFRESDCADKAPFFTLHVQKNDGTFDEATDVSGLSHTVDNPDIHRSGLAAGDLNNDGWLDLVTGFWLGHIQVFLNQGDGTFADVTVEAGVHLDDHGHWQPLIVDFDGDGRQDIYWSVDFGPNELWMNAGNDGAVPQFVDMALHAGCDNAMNDMGIALGDVDDDGDPDLYVTNIFIGDKHNVLLLNQSSPGQPSCEEISRQSGVDDGGWGWGAVFRDFDQDGWLDLAETNGWERHFVQPNRLYLNQQSSAPMFVDVADAAGLADETEWGSALIAVDLDRDGDQDLLQSQARPRSAPAIEPESIYFYRNQLQNAGEHNYLTIKPRQEGTNDRAIGAKVTITIGARVSSSWVLAGSSFFGQEPAEVHFGVGPARRIDRLEVKWPAGGVTRLTNIAANDVVLVHRNTLFADDFEGPRDE